MREDPAVSGGIGAVLLDNECRRRGTCSLYQVCDAYPAGIPLRIYTGEEPHLTVQPDQQGDVVYERKARED